MTAEELTPARAAYRLTHVLNTFADAHDLVRFPVDVAELAKGAAEVFHWTDAITEVKAAALAHFEGALAPGEGRRNWMLLYNDRLTSQGRIRFTQAHELGHYILHRMRMDSPGCTEMDMLDWSEDEANFEAQADTFASMLLMPLDDFRMQVTGTPDFDMLGHCADRYGVSLTAATLKWLECTDAKAVLVVHRDGFIDWAWSSKPAMRAGAFFKTRGRVIAIPDASLAMNDTVQRERAGIEVAARVWFPHAPSDMSLREMKIRADQYDFVLTLLVLPRGADVWPPRATEEDSE